MLFPQPFCVPSDSHSSSPIFTSTWAQPAQLPRHPPGSGALPPYAPVLSHPSCSLSRGGFQQPCLCLLLPWPSFSQDGPAGSFMVTTLNLPGTWDRTNKPL